MQITVIGVYDNYSQAQSALNELIARGFNRSNIQMSPEQESYDARKTALSGSDKDEGWSIGKFFHSIFGSDEDSSTHGDVYHEAVRRGSYMVTVQADSETQRDEASGILNQFSPVNIDERSSQWRTQGWSKYDRSTSAFTDDEVTRERGLYGSAATTGTRAAAGTTTTGRAANAETAKEDKTDKVSGETRLPGIEEELQIGKRAVQRGGVRIYQSDTGDTTGTTNTLGTGAGGAFDSNFYRNHWQTSFASHGGRYEDYEPAYRYGNDMRSNQTYRGRSWNDMEPELRRDWESKHAGSPWERAKDAVRHAWEKIPG